MGMGDIEQLLERWQLDAGAYANRAISYTHLGNDVDARKDSERAIQLGVDRGPLESAIEEAKKQR